MEFVDEDKLLPPSCDTPLMKTRLDPVVVMNLRHELVRMILLLIKIQLLKKINCNNVSK